MSSPRDLEDDSVDYWRRDERTIKLHGPEGFEGMRRAGRLAAETLDFITPYVQPGVSTGELDKLCHDYILDHKAIPAPLGYRGYPKSICTSINHVVCHGIPGAKARAEKLGLPIVAEIVTKQSGIDVTPEVAKLRRARPDIIIFQGYISAPMPEFVRQLREAGLNPQIMGTAWGMDRPAYDAMGALGVRLTGVSMYRYSHETDSPMINNMREYLAKNRPELKQISPFFISSWLSGMAFAEMAERCAKANKWRLVR